MYSNLLIICKCCLTVQLDLKYIAFPNSTGVLSIDIESVSSASTSFPLNFTIGHSKIQQLDFFQAIGKWII